MIGSTPRLLAYRPGESFLHRLDPRTKVLAAGGLVAGALLAGNPTSMVAVYLLGLAAGLSASHLLPDLWRTLRPLIALIIVFGVLVTVVTPGHALAHIWIITPTTDGIHLAVRLGLQAILIVYTTSLLTLSTAPLAIASALEWALGFLARFRLPVRDIIAMVAIGLTFVPLLIAETQKVIAAQRARGADLGMNALLEEESMGALLIPLLLANLRRGEELAESMDARLYATGPRTSLRALHFHRVDLLTGLAIALALVVIILLAFVIPSPI